MDIRNAKKAELDHLARLWHDAWQESHAPHMAAELIALRTLESFRERLETMLPGLRVIGPAGAPSGFCATKRDELFQLYLSPGARGTGAANTLLADAERIISDGGFDTAW